MTPLHLFRETPVRIGSLPLLWKIVLAATPSIVIAVLVTAAVADDYCESRHHHVRVHFVEVPR